jgi:ketosteroid isomerase-like protein
MNFKDPKLTALQFNEYINKQDIESLANLMTEKHTFIDRDGFVVKPKEKMIKAWVKFFQLFPEYKNTFTRVESKDNLVILIGYAYWDEKNNHDSAIWTAKIENDLVAEWRIYPDTEKSKRILR